MKILIFIMLLTFIFIVMGIVEDFKHPCLTKGPCNTDLIPIYVNNMMILSPMTSCECLERK